MENKLKSLIVEQKTLSQERDEAIKAESLPLLADVLKRGANPNFVVNKFETDLFNSLIFWSKASDVEAAIHLLLAHQGNVNSGLPTNGGILTTIRNQKEALENNMVTQTLIYNVEESAARIQQFEAIEQVFLKNGALPIMPLDRKMTYPFFRRGKKNPELVDNPLFNYAITENTPPYQLRKTLGIKGLNASESYTLYLKGVSKKSTVKIPEYLLWNFHRFGTSTTVLPDGSVVFIGGEHEDYYDPDFCIFNDVLVIDKTGKMRLFFYPESSFKPTDFHTATYVDNSIVIIGNLGYVADRKEQETQVYRLHLSDFSMEEISTKGEKPGAISDHSAILHEGKIVVWDGKLFKENKLIHNKNMFSLDVKSWTWKNCGEIDI
jgi:hypothetical protein